MTNVSFTVDYISLFVAHATTQVVMKKLYPKDYTSSVSTRVSNSLLVGMSTRSSIFKLCPDAPCVD